jgi:ankyrin repeat protein
VALYVALRGNSLAVAEVLMAHSRLDPNASNAVGETPLMMAALRGRWH